MNNLFLIYLIQWIVNILVQTSLISTHSLIHYSNPFFLLILYYPFNNSLLVYPFIHAQVYLKFSKSELAKADVIKQMFVVNNVYNSAIKGTGSQKNVLCSSRDEDPDPTCNNGFIKLFLSWTKYKSESTNSSIKWWVIISNFIPTNLKYKNIFFFI